jgi:hypothetical protein
MFIPHRFDIKPYLKQSRNKLYIKLVSALHHTDRLLHRYGKLGRHHLRDPRSAYIRKAAYQFGSEFGPARTGMFGSKEAISQPLKTCIFVPSTVISILPTSVSLWS